MYSSKQQSFQKISQFLTILEDNNVEYDYDISSRTLLFSYDGYDYVLPDNCSKIKVYRGDEMFDDDPVWIMSYFAKQFKANDDFLR